MVHEVFISLYNNFFFFFLLYTIQVNVHGYQQQGGHRLELYEAVRDERNARRRRISAQGRLRAQTDAKDIDNALDAGHGTSEDGAPLEATTAAAIGSTFSTRAPLELELWNSEYGDGDGSGVSLAANLNLDLFLLHPSGWVYWQMLDATSGYTFLVDSRDSCVLFFILNLVVHSLDPVITDGCF